MTTSGFLTGAALVTPIVLAYAALLRLADRFKPPRLGLLLAALCWGAIVSASASLASTLLAGDELVRLFHLRPGGPTAMGASDLVVAPVVEEACKGLGLVVVLVLRRRRPFELDGVLDGMILGGFVGLGFTLTEDLLYTVEAFDRDGLGGAANVAFIRTVLGGLGHCTFTAMTGIGIGLAVEGRTRLVRALSPIVLWVGAVSLHAIHNLLASGAPGTLLTEVLVSWGVDVLFFAAVAWLVRRERGIVLRELEPEVGILLDRAELEAATSYVALDLSLLRVAWSSGLREALLRREKQRLLIELAAAKHQRALGRGADDTGALELATRERIAASTATGIRLTIANAGASPPGPPQIA